MFTLGAMPLPEQVRPTGGPLDTIAGGYTLIPQKYYHPNVARNALGLVGGNEVSLVSGNLVDLESDLRGVTRDISRCPAKKYAPSCALGGVAEAAAPSGSSPIGAVAGICPSWPNQLVFQERSTGRVVTVNTTPRHLPTTQYASYPGVPAPEPLTQQVYGAPWRF
jgi:hypothetical protein